ncbi:hypothetical protein [Pontibacter fetidus]|uniref:Lipocalin-like domain-containing protein n=1 Tax=Pontibacter fetidus TaxID=2700082 RepID=A0A6B2H5G9_9BACT|nr:hypothetical protein [Pontibacter fetidus]NDK55946.1 hypothetical protein [Pontibacter fetidus]
MKKLQFLSYLFAALLMFTTVSCDDDDDNDNVNPDKEALLLADVWTGSKIYLGGQDVTEDYKDIFDVTTVSVKFYEDGTYTFDMDGTAEDGTWEFANNQTQVLLDKGTDDEELVDINKLTATELWAEGDLTGMGQDVEIRFVH